MSRRQADINVANWLMSGIIERSFRSVDTFLPTVAIGPSRQVRDVPVHARRLELASTAVDGHTSRLTCTAADVVRATQTQALVIVHRGQIVSEYFADGFDPRQAWLMMSCTKSLIGLVCGALIGEQALDPTLPVSHYVPELASSGYGPVVVRHVLDMRTSVDFIEDYSDPNSAARRMEEAIGWRPSNSPQAGGYAFLSTVRSAGLAGNGFTYRSADTDVLGWVAERAGRAPINDLIQRYIWDPAGSAGAASMIVDPAGDAVHDGGLSAGAYDMARVGLHLLDIIAGSAASGAAVPANWLRDALVPPEDVVDAFSTSKYATTLPGGWYRSQMWGWADPHPALVFLGIHGQAVYLDPASEVVAVKQSSWPIPSDPVKLKATLEMFRAVSRQLAPRPRESGPLAP